MPTWERFWEGEILLSWASSMSVTLRFMSAWICLSLKYDDVSKSNTELTCHLRSGGWVVFRESGGRGSSPWAGLAPVCGGRGRGRSRWFTWAPADRAAPQSSLAAMSSLCAVHHCFIVHGLKPENINLKPFPLDYHCPRLTLRCIMVSLYSTLSSSILLLVELTRGMKSEGREDQSPSNQHTATPGPGAPAEAWGILSDPNPQIILAQNGQNLNISVR